MGDMRQAMEIMFTTPMKKLVKKTIRGNAVYTVYPYVNGREKGFMISDSNEGRRAVCFSESRGSDSVVFYIGNFIRDYTKEKDPLTFEFIDCDYIGLTDEIYENHSYYVWCDIPKFFKKVGESLASFLMGKLTEKDFINHLKLINKESHEYLDSIQIQG